MPKRKDKWPPFLPDIENYTLGDWIGWFSIVFAIGAIFMGVMAMQV